MPARSALLLSLTLFASLVASAADDVAPEPLMRLGSLRLRHAAAVASLAFDAEAPLLVSRSVQGEERAWSVEDGSEAALPPRSAEPDALAAVRARPQTSVRSADDGSAWIAWSPEDGRAVLGRPGSPDRELDLPVQDVMDASFTSDGRRVLVVGQVIRTRDDFGTWVRCHAGEDATLLWQVELAGMAPSAMARAPAHGTRPETLLVSGRDGRVQRLALDDGAVLTSWSAHEVYVSALAAGPGGALVTGSAAGELGAWRLDPGGGDGPEALWTVPAHEASVTALAVSPDRGLVASGARDLRVRLWRWADGAPHAEPVSHEARMTRATLSPGGALTADWSGRVGLWSPEGRHLAWVQAHEGRVTGLARVAGDRPLLVTAGQDGHLALWDERGRPAGVRVATEAAVLDLALTADGAHLATSGGDGRVRLWSLESSATGAPILAPRGQLPGGRSVAQALAYLPGGEALAIGTSDVRLVQAGDGGVRWETALRAPVADLDVSADGRMLAAALASRAVVVLDTLDGAELWRWSGHPGRVTAVAFSPDGRRVAAGGGDDDVRIRAISGTDELLRLAGHLGEVTTLSWRADGVLVSGSADGTAVVWRP